MSVTNYNPDMCRYSIGKLMDVVYLVSESAVKDIRIDNGDAFVQSISETPIKLDCYSLSLSEEESLDERYRFTHTLTFSVNGYANRDDFQGRYYAIVRDYEGTWWLVNPLFPCKVTYTYTLGYEQNQTDFTISTASNHPVLRLNGMTDVGSYQCKDYWLNGIDRLWLNEKKYTVHSGNSVKYTNGGFKEVKYNKTSATFIESFDGENTSHSIEFGILFSDYKSSWHYNLLEFNDNLYSAVIKTTDDKYALCGFSFGLQPGYTVTSDDAITELNRIQITLQDAHDAGDMITFYDDISYEYLSGKTWEYTSEYDGYECVSAGVARYLLQKEVDALGNETGRYKALSGYSSRFPGIDIVGEFTDTTEFLNNDCTGEGCTVSTSLPSTIRFTTKETQTYTLKADTNWSIVSSSEYIVVSPSAGNADAYYVISVENKLTPTSTAVTASLTLSYCDTTRNIDVVVMLDDDSCFYQGRTYDIPANAQTVTIPSNCCILSVRESTNYGVQPSYTQNSISAYVPENNSGINRTIILLVVFCDGTSQNVIINQSNVFEMLVNEGTICIGRDLYDIERVYTGTTSGSITARTETVRNVLKETNSRECMTPEHKVVDTGGYICAECTPTKYYNIDTNGNIATGTCDSSTFTSSDIANKATLVSSQLASCVTAIGDNAFSGCTILESVMIPEGVTTIGENAFYGCSAATDIILPETVTAIGTNAFRNCRVLTNVVLPNGITSIGEGAFYGCKNFSTVNIPSTLASIPKYCFRDASGLFMVDLPDSITSIGDMAFADCLSLTYLYSRNLTPPTFLGQYPNNAFGGTALSKIYVPSQAIDLYKAATVWKNYKNIIYPIE